jgi:hypothetical protein
VPEAQAWRLLTGGSTVAPKALVGLLACELLLLALGNSVIASATVVVPTRENPLRDVITRGTRVILTLACLVVAMEGVAAASRVDPAPEINPSSISVGLGILVSGGLILRSRRRK